MHGEQTEGEGEEGGLAPIHPPPAASPHIYITVEFNQKLLLVRSAGCILTPMSHRASPNPTVLLVQLIALHEVLSLDCQPLERNADGAIKRYKFAKRQGKVRSAAPALVRRTR